jgi:hypothetical protein
MSVSERSALASSWLEGGAGPSSSQQGMQELEDSRAEEDSGSRHSSMSSDVDESPPDMLETWVIMVSRSQAVPRLCWLGDKLLSALQRYSCLACLSCCLLCTTEPASLGSCQPGDMLCCAVS